MSSLKKNKKKFFTVKKNFLLFFSILLILLPFKKASAALFLAAPVAYWIWGIVVSVVGGETINLLTTGRTFTGSYVATGVLWALNALLFAVLNVLAFLLQAAAGILEIGIRVEFLQAVLNSSGVLTGWQVI